MKRQASILLVFLLLLGGVFAADFSLTNNLNGQQKNISNVTQVNATTIRATTLIASSLTVSGGNVCLSDGTNCPVISSGNGGGWGNTSTTTTTNFNAVIASGGNLSVAGGINVVSVAAACPTNYSQTWDNISSRLCVFQNYSTSSGGASGNATVSGASPYMTYFGSNTSVNSTNIYYQASTGNVGFGTATPGFTIDVNGNISVGGFGNFYNGLNVVSGNTELQYVHVNGDLNQTTGLAYLRGTTITVGSGTTPITINLSATSTVATMKVVNSSGATVFKITTSGIGQVNLTTTSANGTQGTCYMNDSKSWVCV